MTFAQQIKDKLHENPYQEWIQNGEEKIKKLDVRKDLQLLEDTLKNHNIKRVDQLIVGIAMKTSYEFILADLLCLIKQSVSLPVPLDFEDEQLKSLLQNVNVVLVRTDTDIKRISSILPEKPIINIANGYSRNCELIEHTRKNLSKNIVKIIHTSGTTSCPKGVMIRDESLSILLTSLLAALPQQSLSYATFLPLSLLVEQIFAIYCTLLSGGMLSILPDSLKDFGNFAEDSEHYFSFLSKSSPNFSYLPPKLLEDLLHSKNLHQVNKKAFYITGGAKISYQVLQQLDQEGIKVYEGYGLSETTSVVSINSQENRKIGSAGKILSHLEYKVVDQELLLKGPTLCAGYFTKDESSCEIDAEGFLHTGDIVEVDKNGFVTITGRKKNLIILSNARNISPEWVESKIKRHEIIDECVVLGEGKDFLTALIHSKNANNLNSIIQEVNSELPEFSKVKKIVTLTKLDLFRKKYFTVNGRPKRSIIHKEFSYVL